MKLLSEELELIRLLGRYSEAYFSKTGGQLPEALDAIQDFIRRQKIAHGDMVIGQDEPMKDGEDTNQLIAAENQRLRKRNWLRAEQRARNK